MRTRLGGSGHCGVRSPHPTHLYPSGVVDKAYNVVMIECPGQYSHCLNCDDVGCMDCVLRHYHDACSWSCPDCERGDADYMKNVFLEEDTSCSRAAEAESYLRFFSQQLTFGKITVDVFLQRVGGEIDLLREVDES